jgi:dihydrodipicolinate synthase/N-acetylneuraminate lyase
VTDPNDDYKGGTPGSTLSISEYSLGCEGVIAAIENILPFRADYLADMHGAKTSFKLADLVI